MRPWERVSGGRSGDLGGVRVRVGGRLGVQVAGGTSGGRTGATDLVRVLGDGLGLLRHLGEGVGPRAPSPVVHPN